MELTIDRRRFAEQFGVASSFAANRTSIPILKDVLMSCEGGKLRFACSNTEQHITVDGDGVLVDDFKVVLPLDRVSQILKVIRTSEIKLIQHKDKIEIRGGRSKFNLQIQNPDEFPAWSESKESQLFVCDTTRLAFAMRACLTSASVNHEQYALAGVLIEIKDGEINCVSTDGRRMTVCQLGDSEGDDIAAIIPSQAAIHISRLADEGECEVKLSHRDATFRIGGRKISTRLVEGRFPKWRSVMMDYDDCDAKGKVQVANFINVVDATMVIRSEESRAFDFKIAGGELSASGHTADVGEISASCEIESDGEAESGFDSQFLRDVLGVLPMDANVEFGIKGAAGVFRCEPSDMSVIVMGVDRDK